MGAKPGIGKGLVEKYQWPPDPRDRHANRRMEAAARPARLCATEPLPCALCSMACRRRRTGRETDGYH
jgi:hypothetical protein